MARVRSKFLLVLALLLVASYVTYRVSDRYGNPLTAQVSPPPPYTPEQLAIQMVKGPTPEETAAPGQRGIKLMQFKAIANGGQDIVINKAIVAAAMGSTLDMQRYSLWVDGNGDGTAETQVYDTGTVSGSVPLNFMAQGGTCPINKCMSSVVDQNGRYVITLNGINGQLSPECSFGRYSYEVLGGQARVIDVAGSILTFDSTVSGKVRVTVTDPSYYWAEFDIGRPISSSSSSSVALPLCGNGRLESTEECEAGIPCPTGFTCDHFLCRCSAVVTSSSQAGTNLQGDLLAQTSTSADLSISMIGPASVSKSGENVLYTVTVMNNGPSDANSASVMGRVPSGLTFQQKLGDSRCTLSNPYVICRGIAIKKKTAQKIMVGFTTQSTICNQKTITNVVQVVPGIADPNTANNTSSQVTTKVNCSYSSSIYSSGASSSWPVADLSLTMTAPKSTTPGGQLTLTLDYGNNGPNAAQNATVNYPIPSGLQYVPSLSFAGCIQQGTYVVCGPMTIEAGVTSRVFLVFTVPATAACNSTIRHQANVTSGTSDPNPDNNTAANISTLVSCASSVSSAGCSTVKDGICPAGCAAGSDYDCCYMKTGYQWVPGQGCYPISSSSTSAPCGGKCKDATPVCYPADGNCYECNTDTDCIKNPIYSSVGKTMCWREVSTWGMGVCKAKCGDGIVGSGEQCDDGNATSGDGCSATCTAETGWGCTTQSSGTSLCAPICGDGVVMHEKCDDGNMVSGDGCTATCTIEDGWRCSGSPSYCMKTRCPSGYLCAINPDCSAAPPTCTMSEVLNGSSCYYVNPATGLDCSASCYRCASSSSSPNSSSSALCGNGYVEAGEQCDDLNNAYGDGCSATCTVERGYTCTGSPSRCSPVCGDGIKVGTEQCDDGNTVSGDGCSSTCTIESLSSSSALCGNGRLEGAEQCDDLNNAYGDGCSATCTVERGYTCTGSPSRCSPVCGDGIKVGDEQCDDGNLIDHDGCSSLCQVESVCGNGRLEPGERCESGIPCPVCTVEPCPSVCDRNTCTCSFGSSSSSSWQYCPLGYTCTVDQYSSGNTTNQCVQLFMDCANFTSPICDDGGCGNGGSCSGKCCRCPPPSSSSSSSSSTPSTDLALTANILSPPVPGKLFAYQFVVTNRGPSKDGFTLLTYVPDRLTLTTMNPSCMQQGTSILCSGASLAAGERFAIEVTFSVPTDYPCNGMIQNTAAVLGRNRDPNPGDNFISLYTPVTQCSSSSYSSYMSSRSSFWSSSFSYSSSSAGVGARCYTPSDCSSGLVCSTTYGVCDHPSCLPGQQCPTQCSGLCVHPRPRPCDGWLLTAGKTTLFEVRADVATQPANESFRLGFDTRNLSFMQAYRYADGSPLTGIRLNGVCPTSTSCAIGVTTADATLWHLKNTVSQGNLYVTKDAVSDSPRQILGGTLGDPVLRLNFRAEGEPVDVKSIFIVNGGGVTSIDSLELWLDGGTRPFAITSSCPPEVVGQNVYCVSMQGQQLVVPQGADVKVLVKPRLKTDVTGAQSNESIQLQVLASVGGMDAIEAIGTLSSNRLIRNDGDTTADGEVFVGTSVPAPNQYIVGSNNVTVLSKVVSVVNGGAATGTVPSGTDREIGSFKFSAATNANTKNGLNQVVIDGLVFTVNSSNVAMASTGFKIYNRAAGSATNLNCSPFTTSGRVINGTASGTFLLWCTDLETGIVDTTIDQGTSDKFALLANVTNPNSGAAWGATSTLQVSLNDFTNSAKTVFGIGSGQSRIRWRDADSGSSTIFTWIEYPDSAVNSTTYRG